MCGQQIKTGIWAKWELGFRFYYGTVDSEGKTPKWEKICLASEEVGILACIENAFVWEEKEKLL